MQNGSAGSEELLSIVYDELRKLAAAKLNHERPGQTLQATALVHEAYVRLVDDENPRQWDSRGHFFAAAAEAMRRILIENARRKKSLKRGGNYSRQELAESQIVAPEPSLDIEALDKALARFAQLEPQAAELVKLRYFAGMTVNEAADVMGISPRTAARQCA
ncbi:MAG: sigma-70 family RNA polymerase sigma factor, partial [Cephaloticoccus sp.]|nr:sigma-70 family RNA polymerase sigma factor [Cephaloticoccus sp.]